MSAADRMERVWTARNIPSGDRPSIHLKQVIIGFLPLSHHGQHHESRRLLWYPRRGCFVWSQGLHQTSQPARDIGHDARSQSGRGSLDCEFGNGMAGDLEGPFSLIV